MLALRCALFFTVVHSPDASSAIPRDARQVVLVTTKSWTDSRATVQRYSRTRPGEAWARVGRAEPALVGERGLAWGLGLHAMPGDAARRKREGDRCAPAGVFFLGGAFGQLAPAELGTLRVPYRRITADLLAVDDPRSRFYNRIVDGATVARPDWRSAERLAAGRHYRLALAVAHNPRNVPGAGSCIFLHEWIGRRTGTAGCTVLRGPALLELARWLDPAARPVLVQVPESEEQRIALVAR